MPKKGCFKDLTGQRFGRWTVVELARESYRDSMGKRFNTQWRCRCDCGRYADIAVGNLTKGLSKSCGCLKREELTKHGLCRTDMYGIWTGIRHRCYNENHEHFDRYGGRGITLAAEWIHDVVAFVNDVEQQIGVRPSKLHTIDRVDNDKGYEPGNLKWSTWIEQANNRTSTKRLTHDGKTLPLMVWAEELGLNPFILCRRLKNGWDVFTILTTPTASGFRRRRAETPACGTPVTA